MNELVVMQNLIHNIRGQKVMLDSDLAMLYGVLTKNLNKAVKRNVQRFPEDFMFQLTEEEYESLRFQIGTSKPKRGGICIHRAGNCYAIKRIKIRTGNFG